jgi:hypothetical protein
MTPPSDELRRWENLSTPAKILADLALLRAERDTQ